MGHSKEHRDRIATGRVQTAAIRRYLEHLATDHRRQRTPARVEADLHTVKEATSNQPDPIKRLELVQRRLNLETELKAIKPGPDPADLEAEFVDVAAEFAERKGISYAAFREMSVPANVLREAGLRP